MDARTPSRVVEALKWPIALLTVLLLPGAARAAWRAALALELPQDAPLFVGFFGYLVLWWLFFRRRGWGSLVPTLLHESTHALFALATFHRVTGFRASWRSGGRVGFQGPGNWLIFVAPYFFPLLVVVLLGVLALVPEVPRAPARGLLGAAVALQGLATWRETHAGQTDLQTVGYTFSLAFLPTANLLALAVVLRAAAAGPRAATVVGTDLLWWARRIVELASP